MKRNETLMRRVVGERDILIPIEVEDDVGCSKKRSLATKKISIVGAGHVGMAIANSILNQDLSEELALVDTNADKLLGEQLDLLHSAAFLPRTVVTAASHLSVTASSDVVIIAAGARKRVDESREDLLRRNVDLFREIVPTVAEKSPDAVLIVVSNPVDALSYVAWKLSGFPPNRVMGSGTNLDSSRFQFLLANYFDVNAQDVQAFMVGEHGESSITLWSNINVGGVPILSWLLEDKEGKEVWEQYFKEGVLEKIKKAVVESAEEVVRLKGYTSWAIGHSVGAITRSLVRDQRRIQPVSLLAKGLCGIPDDVEVFLSLPALLGRGGVVSVAQLQLSHDETTTLRHSAEALSNMLTDYRVL